MYTLDQRPAPTLDAEDELFHSEVVTIDPAAGTMQGLAAFKGYEEAFHRAFPDGKLTMQSAVAEGNTIVVEGTFTGAHTGPLAGPAGQVPATGHPLNLPFSDVFQVEDGLIVRHRIYYDQLTFLGQLGLIPAPAAL